MIPPPSLTASSTKLDQFSMRDFKGGGIYINKVNPLTAIAVIIGGAVAYNVVTGTKKKTRKRGAK